MRRANRKDSNHAEIVAGLRAHGIVVFDMPDPGDVLCYGPFHYGTNRAWIWLPLEFKSDRKTRGYKPEMTTSQQRRAESGAVIPVVHSLAEALARFSIDPPPVDGEKKDCIMSTPKPDDVDATHLLNTIDGSVWAKEFCRITGFQDEAWALAWFCNAIMAGFDEANRRRDHGSISQEHP